MTTTNIIVAIVLFFLAGVITLGDEIGPKVVSGLALLAVVSLGGGVLFYGLGLLG